MRAVLGRLSQDRFLIRSVAVALKVGACLFVLFSLPTFFGAGKLLFELPSNAILGAVLFEAFFVLAVYAATHTLLLRAQDVDNVRAGEFVVLRLAPMLLRTLAEAYAAFVVLVAFGGGLFVWFTNLGVEKVLNPVARSLFPSAENTTFMGGIEFMLSGVLAAVGLLLIAYALAEAIQLATRSLRPMETSRPAAEDRFRARFGS